MRGDAHIAFQVVGSGPLDLLFIPGLISHLDLEWEDTAYRSFVKMLSRVARVIRFDKLGNGLSDPVAELPSMHDRCGEALAVLEAAGSREVVAFGHCEGGPIALQLSVQRPDLVRGLVLYGTGPRATPPEAVQGFSRTVDCWGSGATIDLFASTLADDLRARTARGRLERAAASPALALATFQALGKADVQHLLPKITVPTLVVHRRDEIVPIEEGRLLAEGIAGAQFCEIAGRDHLPWVGDTRPLINAVAGFFQTHWPAAHGEAELRPTVGRPVRPLTGLDSLTPRELEVARLVAVGLSNPEISRELFVSRHTVESHLKSVSAKLGVDGRARLSALIRRTKNP